MSNDHSPPRPREAAADPGLWEFVRLHEYRRPSVPARSAAARNWARLRNLFRRGNDDTQAPLRREADLRALPELRLKHLVPELDWAGAAAALEATLAAASGGGADSVCVVVGQPPGGHDEIVRHWARRQHASLVEAPEASQILAADRGWLDALPGPERPWALPNLEWIFLRHADGLGLVREVLERAVAAGTGRALIGCDSWAWAYLQRIWPVGQPPALTLQAFDGERLARLFAQLAGGRRRRPLRFRNAASGDDLLAVPAQEGPVSAELGRLAAHCRGNAGTARAYWRERLRAEPEEAEAIEAAEASAAEAEVGAPREELVWVSERLHEPAMPVETDEDTAFVLHALLLHNGLPAAVLPELLPLPHHRCMAVAQRLQALGLVRERAGRLAVDALGYAVVRDLLRGRDYLTDDF